MTDRHPMTDWVLRNAGEPVTPDLTFREYTLARNWYLLVNASKQGDLFGRISVEFFEGGALYPTVMADLWFEDGGQGFLRDKEAWAKRVRTACFENDVTVAPQYINFLVRTIDNPDTEWDFTE